MAHLAGWVMERILWVHNFIKVFNIVLYPTAIYRESTIIPFLCCHIIMYMFLPLLMIAINWMLKLCMTINLFWLDLKWPLISSGGHGIIFCRHRSAGSCFTYIFIGIDTEIEVRVAPLVIRQFDCRLTDDTILTENRGINFYSMTVPQSILNLCRFGLQKQEIAKKITQNQPLRKGRRQTIVTTAYLGANW